MKRRISSGEIKDGDLVRCEGHNGEDSAVEYRAVGDYDAVSVSGRYYLLDRPFEPVWGTVVGLVGEPSSRAVYLPGVAGDENPWLAQKGWVRHSDILDWMGQTDPWVVLEGPEEGKDYV